MWFSPAKLNLGLRIVGRRPDGYHLLESLFWPINFGDDLTLNSLEPTSVFCDWAEDAPFRNTPLFQNDKNLVGKLLLGDLGSKLIKPLTVRVQKRIPIGGGLGGISSNVGTVLRYLVQNKELDEKESEKLAQRLGADVSFFLDPVPSWVTGIGETRQKLKLQPGVKEGLFFLLVLFPFATSTPELFQKYRDSKLDFSASISLDLSRSWDFTDLSGYLETTKNDLEPLVSSHSPLVSKVLETLTLTKPLYSGLSGTGSTCFAVYRKIEERANATKEFRRLCRDLPCRSVLAETYFRHEDSA